MTAMSRHFTDALIAFQVTNAFFSKKYADKTKAYDHCRKQRVEVKNNNIEIKNLLANNRNHMRYCFKNETLRILKI